MEVAGMTYCRILGASNTVEIKVADTIDLRDLRVEKLVVTEGMKVYPDSAACLDIAHFPDTGFVAWAFIRIMTGRSMSRGISYVR